MSSSIVVELNEKSTNTINYKNGDYIQFIESTNCKAFQIKKS